jgi:hypothetical protein
MGEKEEKEEHWRRDRLKVSRANAMNTASFTPPLISGLEPSSGPL